MTACLTGLTLLFATSAIGTGQKITYTYDWAAVHIIRHEFIIEAPALTFCARTSKYRMQAGWTFITAGTKRLDSGLNAVLEICADNICWLHISNASGPGQGRDFIGLLLRF